MMYLYRYEDVRFAGMPIGDGWEEYGSSRLEIVCHRIRVTEETKCGYWVDWPSIFHTRRWVSKTSKKRFAHPTEGEAWKSFQKRKERQIQIYTARLRQAKEALALPRPEPSKL